MRHLWRSVVGSPSVPESAPLQDSALTCSRAWCRLTPWPLCRPLKSSVSSGGARYESRPTATDRWPFPFLGFPMHFCYIDESGDSAAINNPADATQPMLTIGGLFVDAAKLANLTKDFIALKQKFYPGKFQGTTHSLNVLLKEIKGNDLKTDVRNNNLHGRLVQTHLRFLDEVFDICKLHEVKFVARVWVKAFAVAINDRSVYSITAQNFAQRFELFLQQKSSQGILIADFRDPARNSYVAHSVFTQKHKSGSGGDQYPNILETSVYGISNNHACLQITDLLCSAILAPIAGRRIGAGVFNNAHTHPRYEAICKRYQRRLRALQFHCKHNGKNYWGITVSNPHNMKTAIALFK